MVSSASGSTVFEFRGLSSEVSDDFTKWNGVDISNGSVFFCIDTSDVYMFDAENKKWIVLG